MRPFIKAQASSLAASATDFTATIALNVFLHIWYLAASVLGTITGGIVNFLINRYWVFDARNRNGMEDEISLFYEEEDEKCKPVGVQAFRYMMVWVGNLLLNAAGVYLLKHYCDVSLVTSKVFVSIIVGFSYNYVLQKRFVFSRA